MTINIDSPFSSFFDVDGSPLEDGNIYIGTSGLNPLILANQVQIYSDPGLTIPVAQPIKTLGGYPVAQGTPINLYTSLSDYSIIITNKNGELVFASLTNNVITGYVRTATEIAKNVFPVDFTWPENDVDRYNDNDAPIIYLELISALKGGWPFDALRAIPKSKWAAMRTYTSTYDTQPQLALLFGDVGTARRAHIYISDGLWNLGAPLTNIPLRMRLEGSGRRSTGGVGALSTQFSGTCFLATFNTAAPFQINQGVLVPTDILLEHFGIYGTGTGGNIDAIQMTNIAGITLRDMVIDHFTRYGISFSGGNYGVFENIYSARMGNAPYYIDGQFCTMRECSSDSGMTSVLVTALGDALQICGRSHFEGPAIRGLDVAGDRFKMMGGVVTPVIGVFPAWSGATTYYVGNVVTSGGIKYMCIQSHTNQVPPNAAYWFAIVTGFGGARFTSDRWALDGTEITGGYAQNPQLAYGIESDVSANSYRCVGAQVAGFSTAVILREGLGTFVGNNIAGEVTGLELVGGNYIGIIEGNHIAGVTNSILHTSGNGRWRIGVNRLCDAAAPQIFKPMVVTAGFPYVTGNMYDGNGAPTVASAAAINLPYDTTIVNISGVTNITSINASGHQNRTVTLIFAGILTFTDGGNLKLNGNFVTTADDTITITCPDGVSWYEVSRSAN